MIETARALLWLPTYRVEKWHEERDWARGTDPDEVLDGKGNLVVTVGLHKILDSLIGVGTPYNSTNSRIGVGNSNTAAALGQTDLQGASKFFKTMDSGYPSRSSLTLSWRATFQSGEANFAWEEWVIDNGTADGSTVTAPILNRRVESLGTKVAGNIWALTVQVTAA